MGRLPQLAAPTVLVLGTAVLGQVASSATQVYFIEALVSVVIVVGLYIFIGNTGVLSFGHISFVALGAWTAGVLSVPTGEKPAFMPSLFGFLLHTTVGNVPSLLLAAVAGGVFALVVAYLFWYNGVRVIGPTRTSMYSNLQPIVAVLVAWPMLGETPTPWQIVGAVCIMGGLVLTRGG